MLAMRPGYLWLLAFALLPGRMAWAAADEPPTPAPDYGNLGVQSLYLGGLSVAIMAELWRLPPSVSQWDTKPPATPSGLYHQWLKDLAAGPVWDGDMRFFNDYAHVHLGAAYTVMCLDDGLSELQCMAYATLVSAGWEYGAEAVVEVPSIQDLIITGLIGSRVGMQFYAWQQALHRQNGELYGSKVLGTVAELCLNPFGLMFRYLPGTMAASLRVTSYPVIVPGSQAWALSAGSRPALGFGYGMGVSF